MPNVARPIGQLTRAWLRWRGDLEGQLQAQEEWTEAMKTGAAYRPCQFEGVYVLSRSKGGQGLVALAQESHLERFKRPLS
jgi:hypothetical protein